MKESIVKRNVVVNRAKFDIEPDNKDVHKGKSVLCITTGAVFKSAKEAANYYNLNYHSFIGHLAGKYKTVGGGVGRGEKKNGLRFCYISEMGYKANDISHYIIELKEDRDKRYTEEQVNHLLHDYKMVIKASEKALKQAEDQIQSILAIMPNLELMHKEKEK